MSPGLKAELAKLDDERFYVRRPDRIVFVEHDEPRKGGKAEKFDKARLQKIADTLNARDRTGTLAPLTLGHTREDAPETEQPPLAGYARGYHVRWDDDVNEGKGGWVIATTFYLRRSRYKEALEYPRVSVERWAPTKTAGDVFDPIALLRKTPQLDLGNWTYARCGRREVVRYAASDWHEGTAMAEEEHVAPVGGDEGADEVYLKHKYGHGHAEKYHRHMMRKYGGEEAKGEGKEEDGKAHEEYERHCYSHPHAAAHYAKMVKKYAAEPPPEPPDGNEEATSYQAAAGEAPAATPAAGPGFAGSHSAKPPGFGKRPEPASRIGDLSRYERELREMRREVTASNDRIKALEDDNTALKYQRDEAECNSILNELEVEGYVFNRERELKTLIPLTPEQRVEYSRDIRDSHKQAPVQRYGRVRTEAAPSQKATTQEQHQAAIRLATRNGWTGAEGYDKALAQVKSQA
jgi:hypothetical protein